MNLKKKILSIASAAMIAVSACCSTVFADDYVFNTEKAKMTYGGGQSFAAYTRLDNERRDKNKFNPLWMTEDSQIIVEYETSEYTTDSPIRLVLQSWTGELVDGTENKWVQILPSVLEDDKAIWDYATLVDSYGDDFSDVYCIVFEDGDENSLLVKSFEITNVDVPEEDAAAIVDGIIEYTETESETETAATETETASVSIEAEDETANTDNAEAESTETEKAEDKSETEEAKKDESKSEAAETENKESNSGMIVIICVAAGVLVLGGAVIIIILRMKGKNKNWR